ncbi:putative leucine-rich repeat receptor-like protein kinase [Nymphaea thermarum]|nr:putative leucine-rich repeat receptor-like protein kinase [Nymphaea thermarum]
MYIWNFYIKINSSDISIYSKYQIFVNFYLLVWDTVAAAALLSLKAQWQRTPPSWEASDPCGAPWDGVNCSNSRVTILKLSSMSLIGTIDGIGSLVQLKVLYVSDLSILTIPSLVLDLPPQFRCRCMLINCSFGCRDLSSNPNLTGPIPRSIGELINLETLILTGCSFTGSIPAEIGNLGKLTALNDNYLSGSIPASLGRLSNLSTLDLAYNGLTGSIPVSSGSEPGLDLLFAAKHFNNQLSGPIPLQLFSSRMNLLHILFHANYFTGEIPETIGLVQSLEILRLDRNQLGGSVPGSLNNLSSITALDLASNHLIGPIPDLGNMEGLSYLDLSNNSFDASLAPPWLTTMKSLTTIIMENGKLEGAVPETLFSLPSIQTIKLRNNSFNGTLTLESINTQLQLVDLENNHISELMPANSYTNSIRLAGNPVCYNSDLRSCKTQIQEPAPYETSSRNCGRDSCQPAMKPNPESCACSYPYTGVLHFRAVFFSDLSNSTIFKSLEEELWRQLDLTPGSVYIWRPEFDDCGHLDVKFGLFPSSGTSFTREEVIEIGFTLSNQNFEPPHEFGPYCFIMSDLYLFLLDPIGRQSLSLSIIIGIAVGCSVLIFILAGVGIYAIRQKKRAERATLQSRPFASWRNTSTKGSGPEPEIKGASCFLYEDIKKCTNNFSEGNIIGVGGFGRVYKGILPSGEIVAIKRAKNGVMQGGLEFKTEIELLSRVHHKNLVSLVGFCFDKGEQMLVYEFIANGTLADCLSGKSKIQLDWHKRLQISLDSATGLAYLHEHANPPIIHRDVKSANILLDEDLTAKVADLGLSKLVPNVAKVHISGQVKGTLGYLDPEYYTTQKLTEKIDVYSFGVVMMELITGKKPIERGTYLVRELQLAMDRSKELYGLEDLLDPAIKKEGALIGFEKFVDLAVRCVEQTGANRPSMRTIVMELESILLKVMDMNPGTAITSFLESSSSDLHHGYNYPLSISGTESHTFSSSNVYTFSKTIEPK